MRAGSISTITRSVFNAAGLLFDLFLRDVTRGFIGFGADYAMMCEDQGEDPLSPERIDFQERVTENSWIECPGPGCERCCHSVHFKF